MYVRSPIPEALRLIALSAVLLPAVTHSQDGSGEPESRLQIDAGAGRYDAAVFAGLRRALLGGAANG